MIRARNDKIEKKRKKDVNKVHNSFWYQGTSLMNVPRISVGELDGEKFKFTLQDCDLR